MLGIRLFLKSHLKELSELIILEKTEENLQQFIGRGF